MPIERTLSIVKPDGVGRNLIGEVYRRFEQAGLRVVACAHDAPVAGRGGGLLRRPSRASVLQGSGEIHDLRSLHGAGAGGRECDRQEPRSDGRNRSEEGGAKGTIRADLATSIDENIVHGSDAPETAAREIAYFFREIEVCPRTR